MNRVLGEGPSIKPNGLRYFVYVDGAIRGGFYRVADVAHFIASTAWKRNADVTLHDREDSILLRRTGIGEYGTIEEIQRGVISILSELTEN